MMSSKEQSLIDFASNEKDSREEKFTLSFGCYVKFSRKSFWQGKKDQDKLLKLFVQKSDDISKTDFEFDSELDVKNDLEQIVREEINKIEWSELFDRIFKRLVE